MAKKSEKTNPFYIVLLVVGVLFGITACAYVVMILMMGDPVQAKQIRDGTPGLILFLDKNGLWLLVGELVLLGITTVISIMLDDRYSGDKASDD